MLHTIQDKTSSVKTGEKIFCFLYLKYDILYVILFPKSGVFTVRKRINYTGTIQ